MNATQYNGWKNRQTWNVALWIGNNESLYRAAVDFARRGKARGWHPTYKTFIKINGLAGTKTPDGVAWDGSRLDYRALSEFLREMAE